MFVTVITLPSQFVDICPMGREGGGGSELDFLETTWPLILTYQNLCNISNYGFDKCCYL
jgi:hypothetical protein